MKKENLYDKGFYEEQYRGSIRSADIFLSYLFSYYKPESMVDFGCGVGSWLFSAEKLGVHSLMGLDGSWVKPESLLSDSIDFKPTNFECAVDLNNSFDLAVSLEVAEHIEEAYANKFVESICNSSSVVVFGAAIPGQGGIDHVNEQFQTYWVEKFKDRGYSCFDIFRTKYWDDKRIEFWYRQNTFLFVHESKIKSINEEILSKPVIMPDLIHPDKYLALVASHNKIRSIVKPLLPLYRFFNSINLKSR